jgi:hypothetical protein
VVMGVDKVVVGVVPEVVGAKELWSRSSATNVIQVASFLRCPPASRSAGTAKRRPPFSGVAAR